MFKTVFKPLPMFSKQDSVQSGMFSKQDSVQSGMFSKQDSVQSIMIKTVFNQLPMFSKQDRVQSSVADPDPHGSGTFARIRNYSAGSISSKM